MTMILWFQWRDYKHIHYNDVKMSAMASQIISLTIVYSTVYSGTDQRKHQSSASLGLCGNSPVTGEFPAQRASIAENVSIWWRHPDSHREAMFKNNFWDISRDHIHHIMSFDYRHWSILALTYDHHCAWWWFNTVCCQGICIQSDDMNTNENSSSGWI